MKNDKYYVPESSELRIGYECEVNALATADRKEDKWVSTCIQRIDHIERAEIALNLKYLRTSYLTKEQLETDGWIKGKWDNFCKPCPNDDSFYKLHRLNKYDDTVSLNYDFQNHELFIDVGSANVLFSGECKDINTFRWICKLLKI